MGEGVARRKRDRCERTVHCDANGRAARSISGVSRPFACGGCDGRPIRPRHAGLAGDADRGGGCQGDIDVRHVEPFSVHALSDGDADGLADVGADLEDTGVIAVEKSGAVELRRVRDARDLLLELRHLGLDVVLCGSAQAAAVGALNGEVAHTLQERVCLTERTFSCLYDADTVLGVADGDPEATDLRAKALRDGKAGCVISGAVDAETAGQFLQRLRHLALRDRQVAIRVQSVDVLINTKTHGIPSIEVS